MYVLSRIFLLWQIESSHKEDCHRVTLDRGSGTVDSGTASAGDGVCDQLLDKVRTEGTDRDITKNARR